MGSPLQQRGELALLPQRRGFSIHLQETPLARKRQGYS